MNKLAGKKPMTNEEKKTPADGRRLRQRRAASRPGKDRRQYSRREEDVYFDISAGSTYFDNKFKTTAHKVNQGEHCVLSKSQHMICTILGSCIAVCICDPVVQVGGMNHFLLPKNNNQEDNSLVSMRYGNNAMEVLINDILKRGGDRRRLEVKAFGAGNVMDINTDIGGKNQRFLKEYMAREGLKLVASDLGGDRPRRVNYFPATGKAFVFQMNRTGDRRIVSEEAAYKKKVESRAVDGEIELF